jgi:hypothetical protein
MPAAPPPLAPSPPTRLAVLFSAVVYPGAGQFLQSRWLAGTLCGGAFTAAFIGFIAEMVRIMHAYLSTAFFDSPPDAPPGYRRLLMFALASLLLFTIGLIDTILAHQRALRRFQSACPPPPP